MVAETQGFPLVRHNVFFSADYPAEFDDIFRARRLPERGTVYVCAQDRGDGGLVRRRGVGALQGLQADRERPQQRPVEALRRICGEHDARRQDRVARLIQRRVAGDHPREHQRPLGQRLATHRPGLHLGDRAQDKADQQEQGAGHHEAPAEHIERGEHAEHDDREPAEAG